MATTGNGENVDADACGSSQAENVGPPVPPHLPVRVKKKRLREDFSVAEFVDLLLHPDTVDWNPELNHNSGNYHLVFTQQRQGQVHEQRKSIKRNGIRTSTSRAGTIEDVVENERNNEVSLSSNKLEMEANPELLSAIFPQRSEASLAKNYSVVRNYRGVNVLVRDTTVPHLYFCECGACSLRIRFYSEPWEEHNSEMPWEEIMNHILTNHHNQLEVDIDEETMNEDEVNEGDGHEEEEVSETSERSPSPLRVYVSASSYAAFIRDENGSSPKESNSSVSEKDVSSEDDEDDSHVGVRGGSTGDEKDNSSVDEQDAVSSSGNITSSPLSKQGSSSEEDDKESSEGEREGMSPILQSGSSGNGDLSPCPHIVKRDSSGRPIPMPDSDSSDDSILSPIMERRSSDANRSPSLKTMRCALPHSRFLRSPNLECGSSDEGKIVTPIMEYDSVEESPEDHNILSPIGEFSPTESDSN